MELDRPYCDVIVQRWEKFVGRKAERIPVATQVAGVLVTAVGALLSPFGSVVAAIAAGIYAWTQWSQTGQTVLAGATTAFRQIYATVRDVFGGISKALAAGDIRLAAEILWAGLKVVFYQGVQAIASVWPALTQAASDAFSYIGVNLGSLFSASAETFSAIGRAIMAGNRSAGGGSRLDRHQIGVRLRAGLGNERLDRDDHGPGHPVGEHGRRNPPDLEQRFVVDRPAALSLVGAIQSALATLAQYDPTGLTGLAQKLSDSLSIDVEGALRTLEEDRQRFNAGIAAAQ